MIRTLGRAAVLASLVAGLTPSVAAAQVNLEGCDTLTFTTSAPMLAADGSGTVIGRTITRSGGLTVEIRCPDLQVFAREIELYDADRRLELRGDVVFQQGGTRITAVKGTVYLRTRTGRFEEASGTLRLGEGEVDRTLFGTLEPEAYFTAAVIEKTGPTTYQLTNATFSTCVQPSRRWQMVSSQITLNVDRYAVMRNARLEVKDVPMLYLPIFYYPIQEDARATGFLMPAYGSSTFRGFTLSNAFFWAISRSSDLTVYHDWFMKSGQGMGIDYRYVGERGARGDARFYMVREKAVLATDGTVTSPARRSYEVRGNLNQPLPFNLRLQAQADYFTDASTQQLYQIDLQSFSRRSRTARADLSGNWGRVRFYGQAERSDIFYGVDSAQGFRYLPRLNVSVADTTLFGSKVTLGGTWSGQRAESLTNIDDPESARRSLRSNGAITLRVPYALGAALSFDGSATVRRTDWSTQRDPDTGATIPEPLSRVYVEWRARVRGPNFSRVIDTPGGFLGERLKHVIQPTFSVKRVTAIDVHERIVQFDSEDTTVGGVTELQYGVTNELFAKVRRGDAMIQRSVATLSFYQTYYSDALAASYDQQYQSSFGGLFSYSPPPSKLSPVRVDFSISPVDGISGGLRFEYDSRFKAIRTFTVSSSVRQRWIDLDGTWTKQRVIEGLAGFSDPRLATHFVSANARLKQPDGRASVAYSTTADLRNSRVLQQRFGLQYNAQCCGVSMDYSVINLAHYGLRNDKRFSVSISLAGIGSFVNPLGMFGNTGERY
jgi:LPS-assembly protein